MPMSQIIIIIISESDSDLEHKKRVFAMERGSIITNEMLKHNMLEHLKK